MAYKALRWTCRPLSTFGTPIRTFKPGIPGTAETVIVHPQRSKGATSTSRYLLQRAVVLWEGNFHEVSGLHHPTSRFTLDLASQGSFVHRKEVMLSLAKRQLRIGASALALIGILVAGMAPAGRYVCLRGMVEAGPSCPECHGAQCTPTPCCKLLSAEKPSSLTPPVVTAARGDIGVGVSATQPLLALPGTILQYSSLAFLDRAGPARPLSSPNILRL